MATSSYSHMALPIPVSCSIQKRSFFSDTSDHSNSTGLFSVFKPMVRTLPQVPKHIDVSKTMKNTAVKLVDAFLDSAFEVMDLPLLPSQSNTAPVEELGEAFPNTVTSIQGQVPADFPEGVYIRNGPNPLFGGRKSTRSIFGRTNHVWVEGEGMLHALYFKKDSDGSFTVSYNNRHVETDTYLLEKQRNKPSFLPTVKGDAPAILAAYLLNQLRFGKVNKCLSNTNVFEHAGKFYSIAENDIPQEINIFNLKTLTNWDIGGTWKRPFTSHPKKAPGTGELVIIGVDGTKPFSEIGIISADGKNLIHKVDIKLNRCSVCHEIGVTHGYNIIMDFPLITDINRLFRGGQLFKYEKDEYARIGVMPRYGDADSIKWFGVEPNATFHIINSFEDGHEVVLWGCRAHDTIIPEPEMGWDEFEFSHCYEWRLNMQTGEVNEKYLTGEKHKLDFPVINANFTGIKNKYGYTEVVDPTVSTNAAMPKFSGLAKLYFEELCTELSGGDKNLEDTVRVEYHMFEKNVFCTGAAFVPKEGGLEEDDGWIITFVHNEDTDISQVYIVDTKKFSGETVAKITLPYRVPYGFHGAFMPISIKA